MIAKGKSSLWSVGFILLCASCLAGCAQWQRWNGTQSNQAMLEQFVDHPHKPTVNTYSYQGRRIRYLSIGADTLPAVMLVHGAPSSLTSWMRYLRDTSLTQRVRLVAVDRPGYGGSDFGKVITSVSRQSELLKPLLDTLSQQGEVTVAGSSYGGTLAARLAMDYPDHLKKVVLISASLAPGQEKIYKISYFFWIPGLKQLIPRMLHLANEEKLHHYETLEEMRPLWSRIRIPVTILHGDKDKLIYYDNALFAEMMLDHSPEVKLVTVNRAGHGLPWSHSELVRSAILGIEDTFGQESQEITIRVH